MDSGKGSLFIISAPSGTGKDTLIHRIMELRPQIVLSVSATTRAPRDGETEGISYYFVTHERFQEMVERGEFQEHAEYIGEHYGTPAKPIYEHISNGTKVILNIEVQGAKQVMALGLDAETVFVVPPNMEELERRLRKRGKDSEENLIERIDRARLELEETINYKHVVVNDDINQATKELLSIIDGENQ